MTDEDAGKQERRDCPSGLLSLVELSEGKLCSFRNRSDGLARTCCCELAASFLVLIESCEERVPRPRTRGELVLRTGNVRQQVRRALWYGSELTDCAGACQDWIAGEATPCRLLRSLLSYNPVLRKTMGLSSASAFTARWLPSLRASVDPGCSQGDSPRFPLLAGLNAAHATPHTEQDKAARCICSTGPR